MVKIPLAGQGQNPADHCRYHEAKSPVHRYLHSMVEIGMMKILLDHEIIETIPDEGDISIRELADKTGAELLILERFSRFLVAAGVLSSPTPGRIAHTADSRTFLDPQAQFCFSHMFNFFLVPAMEWSEYFDINGLVEPKNATRTPFGLASGRTETSFYDDLSNMSGRAASLNGSMNAALWDMPVVGVYDFSWVGEYAAQSSNGNVSSSRPLIVDIGGHTGMALSAILEENPRIPAARCILQDRAESIEMVMKSGVIGDVQSVVMDFLEEQPTKGIIHFSCIRNGPTANNPYRGSHILPPPCSERLARRGLHENSSKHP